MFDFTEEEIRRYSRHILLPEVGGKGQKKINGARVLLIGAGGLGAPAGYYLAAAGVGKIGIVDDDQVELSNLQRQIVHSTEDLGKNKAISAQETLLGLNPGLEVVTYQQRVRSENILDILDDYDIVVDGSDNFPTRYLVNDACVYIVFRISGKTVGTYTGARVSGADEVVQKYLGLCLLPQGGVAVGLSIQAMHEFKTFGPAGVQLGLLAVNVIAATTFILEMIGPPSTRYAIIKAGESHIEEY